MKRVVICLLPLTLAACATSGIDFNDPKTREAGIGAAIGCAGGAVLAKVVTGDGSNMLRGCAMGGALGGYVGWQRARAAELAAAQHLKADLAQVAPAAKVSAVTTEAITKTNDAGQAVQEKTFQSVSVDLPTTAHGQAQYDAAMAKIKALATKVADERGEATIDISGSPKAVGLAPTASADDTIVKTDAGNTIHIRKHVATDLPAGVRRVTVSGGQLV